MSYTATVWTSGQESVVAYTAAEAVWLQFNGWVSGGQPPSPDRASIAATLADLDALVMAGLDMALVNAAIASDRADHQAANSALYATIEALTYESTTARVAENARVTLATNQTITGVKDFLFTPTVRGGPFATAGINGAWSFIDNLDGSATMTMTTGSGLSFIDNLDGSATLSFAPAAQVATEIAYDTDGVPYLI